MRRRVILIPVGALTLMVAGIAGAEIAAESQNTKPTTPAAQPVSVTLPPDYGDTIVEQKAVTVPRERAAGALCEVQPDSVKNLSHISKQVSSIENLRDGLPLLEERLTEVKLAAEGRPALAPVVARLTRVQSLWRKALNAADAGKPKDATAALAAAEKELAGLDTDLAKAYPGAGKDCT